MRSVLRAAWLLPALGLCACAPRLSRHAEILWDRWGVPHIYAAREPDLFHAFGWAQMAAHGDLLLRLYGRARGRAAEYWGERHLASDRWVRTVGVPGLAEAWLHRQSATFRQYLDAFADGINAYAEAHRDRIADEVEVVLPVRPVDVLAHGLWAVHFTFVADAGAARGAERHLAAGSNAWAIAPARSASGHAMLLANPHLPWGGPFTWFEAHLVAPGLNVYGAGLVGFPGLGIAFNDRIGWTHTVNTIDAADLYELTLADGGYRFDGLVHPFETRTEILRVRDANGALRDDTMRVRRSVHGPVIAERGDRAVALRVAGLDAPGMWEQWWEMARARHLAEFERALTPLRVPIFTVMYADRDGHIMHLFGGRVPRRSHGDWDYWTGVVRGDTSATLWNDVHPYGELPRVTDPPSGWLQNANDPPWTTTFPPVLDPDRFPSYLAPQRMEFRAQRSARMLAEDDRITFEELIAYKHSTRMELADRILDELIPAARQYGGPLARQAADVLEAWDRAADAESRGAVLFERWTRAAGPRIFATPWSRNAPRTTPDGLADPPEAVQGLERAARSVEEQYGTLDVAWGDVYRLRLGEHDLPANGGPGWPLGIFRVVGYDEAEAGRYTAVSGDSWVAAIEFSDPIRARALLSYGNATQAHSPHRGDQLPLFARKELREVWRTRAEIEKNLEAREVLPRR